MQAIILAAGMGKRLKEKTKENTKCMVKFFGRPLIEYSLDILTAPEFGITRIVMAVGYFGDKVKKHLGNSYNGVPIIYVNNPVYDKTNNIYSLYLTKSFLLEDDTLLLESDLIFEHSIIKRLLASQNSNVAVIDKYQTWMNGTVVKLQADDNISALIPVHNFNYNEIDKYYKTVNIYKFSRSYMTRSFLPFLEAYCLSQGHNQYYEQVLCPLLALEKNALKVMKLEDELWYEIDDIPDYHNAEFIFCKNAERRYKRCAEFYGGYWRFHFLKDFCYLVNPYFPTQRMIEEFKNSFRNLISNYPSGQATEKLLASNVFDLQPNEVVVGNGAAELISVLMSQLKGKIGIIYPTFEEYLKRIPSNRIVPFKSKPPNFSYAAAELKRFLSQVDSLVLINPDNPSGNLLKKKDLISLISTANEADKIIVVDESFADFADCFTAEDSLLKSELLQQYPNLVAIKSISKSYGIPGARLGILACANYELIQRVGEAIPIWNINSHAEFFLQIMVKYKNAYRDACRKIMENRTAFFLALQEIPYLRAIPSQANYILCEVKKPWTSHKLAVKLLEFNFFIKDCSSKSGFDGHNYIRLAVKSQEDNEALLDIMKKIG